VLCYDFTTQRQSDVYSKLGLGCTHIHQVALRVDVMMNNEPVKITEDIVVLLIKYV